MDEYSKTVQAYGGKYKQIVCHTLSTNFRHSTRIEKETLFPSSLGPTQVLVENRFLGINASDINFTNGRYDPTIAKPPFPCGFECLGTVRAVGSQVNKKTGVKIGDAVAISKFGSFSEFMIIDETELIQIPFLSKEFLSVIVCGITASIALDLVGEMKHTNNNSISGGSGGGETILVTAAAGATGQFAVQLAKLAGNHVIGTCSSQQKVDYLLNTLGCDRVINYRTENVMTVLRKEYPKGIDIVFESVGGDMYNAAINNLAIKGRLIVIGAISGYQDDTAWKKKKTTTTTTEASSSLLSSPKESTRGSRGSSTPIATKLLVKSASIRGFFLNHYFRHRKTHTRKLFHLIQKRLLISGIDAKMFSGLEEIPDALDYMYERKNIGKLIVTLPEKRSKGRRETMTGMSRL